MALGPAWACTLLEHVVVGVLLDVRDQVGLVGARPRLAADGEPGWSKGGESATLEASSNIRDSGWAASGTASPSGSTEAPGATSGALRRHSTAEVGHRQQGVRFTRAAAPLAHG